jgi:hypothetical protein
VVLATAALTAAELQSFQKMLLFENLFNFVVVLKRMWGQT